MKASISKSEILGKATAPSSKSYTIRGLMCAALTHGKSEILSPLASQDTIAATNVLKNIGVSIRQQKKSWTVEGGHFHASSSDLLCGDSAATLRFMTAIGALIPGKCHFTAGPTLSRRPIKTLIDALQQLGVQCSSNGDLPPVTVIGGKLKGGVTSLPGNISSQYVSALLHIAPFAEEGMTIKLTTPLESRPYVMMTMDAMQWFGITVAFNDSLDTFEVLPHRYQPTRFRVEGDWSSASYLLSLGALAGEVKVNNLDTESLQGDRMLLRFLQDMGAAVTAGRNSIIVRQSRLKAIKADLTDCIDLLPTVAVLAAVAEGVSEFTGIERARIKESDRVAAVKEGLVKMGIGVNEDANCLTVTGGKPQGTFIDSKNDHRIAMAFSLLGAVVGDTVIGQAECVAKTYPEFWDVFKNLGGKVITDGQ
ncbi:MAG: 3-phosphoshikimate 1-carboxyvinyltransferase [Dehalococcoidales bacterium]|nr:3-phosphoshikimate 1-carboxyvinyltransferase [Dehalococcoidales bacterium]